MTLANSARATLALLLGLGFAAGATAEIFRCSASDGHVTYQEIPCPASSREKLAAIPTDFPAPNTVERDRLLAREAALDRRLEARRDRETQEAIARAERQSREAEVARLALLEAQSQQYAVAWPLAYGRPHPVFTVHRGPPRGIHLISR